MDLIQIEEEAAEIADQADEISVEYHLEDDDGYWSVFLGLGGDNAAYWGVTTQPVLQELADSYDVYGVTVYNRDGSLWD